MTTFYIVVLIVVCLAAGGFVYVAEYRGTGGADRLPSGDDAASVEARQR